MVLLTLAAGAAVKEDLVVLEGLAVAVAVEQVALLVLQVLVMAPQTVVVVAVAHQEVIPVARQPEAAAALAS